MKTIFNLILLTAILFSTSCSMKYSMVKGNGKMEIAQSVVPHSKPDKISEKRNMPDTAATATEIINTDSIHHSTSKSGKTKQPIISLIHKYATHLYTPKIIKREIAKAGKKHYSKNAEDGDVIEEYVVAVLIVGIWLAVIIGSFITGNIATAIGVLLGGIVVILCLYALTTSYHGW